MHYVYGEHYFKLILWQWYVEARFQLYLSNGRYGNFFVQQIGKKEASEVSTCAYYQDLQEHW